MTSQLARARTAGTAFVGPNSRDGSHLSLIDGGQKRRGARMIAYIRVSNFKDGQGLSPEVQLREIVLFCQREGLVLITVKALTIDKDGHPVVEDLDLSGRTSTDRAVAPMIKAIREDLADGVVVWKISRWGRNMLDSLLNIKDLHDAGGYILSTSENLNEIDTSAGKLSLNAALMIAQFQSDQIGEVWANIRQYRWGGGVPATGWPRWGYVWNRGLAVDDPRLYEIDEDIAPWVRKCYDNYVAGMSFGQLVEMLRKSHIQTLHGSEWTDGSLRQTMDTGFAAGWLVRYPRDKTGRIRRANPDTNVYWPGKHEPIIDDDLWAKYKAARTTRRAKAPTKRATHKLSTLLRCNNCGSTMTLWGTKTEGTKGDRTYRYYVCVRSLSAKRNKLQSHLHCSNPARIRDVVADAKVLDEILRMASTREDVNLILKRQQAARSAKDRSKRIRRDIEDLKLRRSRAYQLLISGEVKDKQLYNDEDARMKARLAQLEMDEQEARIAHQVNEIPETTVFEAIVRGWTVMSPETINAALKQVVRHVRVTNVPHPGRRRADPVVNIRWMWEPDEMANAS